MPAKARTSSSPGWSGGGSLTWRGRPIWDDRADFLLNAEGKLANNIANGVTLHGRYYPHRRPPCCASSGKGRRPMPPAWQPGPMAGRLMSRTLISPTTAN
jgi:hypothetical protein